MDKQHFLFELGTEELPPKSSLNLAHELADNFVKQLNNNLLAFGSIEIFSTPRRLAFLVKDLNLLQEDQVIDKKGPASTAPEQAINGFAQSCQTTKDKLVMRVLKGKEYYYFTQIQAGQKTYDLLPAMLDESVAKLSIAKGMRWGNRESVFVRPVHWLVALLGSKIINLSMFDLNSGNETSGLRFSQTQTLTINTASDYQSVLQKANIIANFDARKKIIRTQVEKIALENNALAVIDEDLLNEVTALVEYPNTILGKFDKSFLEMPKEVLILAMKSHQKYFYCVDKNNELLPLFITVANLKSKDESIVIAGNERVLQPRLNDSMFFLEQDKKNTLESRLSMLKKVMFMQGLGNMADKVSRIKLLSDYLAKQINADAKTVAIASNLLKSDLTTDMVIEFSDLQGFMGGYYAKCEGHNKAICDAISTQYYPRFANDSLPESNEALIIAITDKLDTIVGIFLIGREPTGSKDPFALRRLSLGIMRMIIEKELTLDIEKVLTLALSSYKESSVKMVGSAQEIIDKVYTFMLRRLKIYYKEQDISSHLFDAIYTFKKQTDFYQADLKIKTLKVFSQNENAIALIEANKRIKNILKKASNFGDINEKILIERAELDLYKKVKNIQENTHSNQEMVEQWFELKPLIDIFFETVMVNVEDEPLKNTRLALLQATRNLFLDIGDISFLA
jgi:glycyl-tRNA synthetase beta chain